jgi:predicted secreted protein
LPDILTPSPLQIGPDGKGTIIVEGQGVGGYTWSAQVVSGDGEVEESSADGTPPTGIGGSTLTTFVVTWHGHGNGTVRLVYKRGWEDEPETVREIAISAS